LLLSGYQLASHPRAVVERHRLPVAFLEAAEEAAVDLLPSALVALEGEVGLLRLAWVEVVVHGYYHEVEEHEEEPQLDCWEVVMEAL